MIPWAGAVRCVLWRDVERPRAHSNPHYEQGRAKKWFRRWLALLMEPMEFLVMPAQRGCEPERDVSPVCAPYRCCRLWYFNVELAFAAINGVFIGIAFVATDPCMALTVGWLLVAAAALECAAAIVWRPFSALIDLVILITVGTLTIASEMIALLVVDNDAADAVSNGLGLAGCVVQLAGALLLGVDVVYNGRTTHVPAVSTSPRGGNARKRLDLDLRHKRTKRQAALKTLVNCICASRGAVSQPHRSLVDH
jgi:hypothetical protein